MYTSYSNYSMTYHYPCLIVGESIVGHNLPEDTEIPKCEELNCFSVNISYPSSVIRMKALAEVSLSCSQKIKVTYIILAATNNYLIKYFQKDIFLMSAIIHP